MVNPGRLGDRPEAFTGFEPLAGFLLLMVVELRFVAEPSAALDGARRTRSGHGDTLRAWATSRLSSPLLSPFGDIDCKKTLQSRS
jgi:hypothetical protein